MTHRHLTVRICIVMVLCCAPIHAQELQVEQKTRVDEAIPKKAPAKPKEEAATELCDELKGKGLVYRSPIVRLRQRFDLFNAFFYK